MYKLNLSVSQRYIRQTRAVRRSYMAWSPCRTFLLQTLTFTLTAAPLSLIFRIFERRMLPLYEAIGEKTLRVWSDCNSGTRGTVSDILLARFHRNYVTSPH